MAGNWSQEEATLPRGREARSNWMVIVDDDDDDDDGKKLWPRGTLVTRIRDHPVDCGKNEGQKLKVFFLCGTFVILNVVYKVIGL